MKLPIQSQPVLRNVSTARISLGSSMVHPQRECRSRATRLVEDCDCNLGRFAETEDRIRCISCRLGTNIFCDTNHAACCE